MVLNPCINNNARDRCEEKAGVMDHDAGAAKSRQYAHAD